jgi:phosphoglycolate phosphatase-like HAD superfamily hydrolase
MTTAKALLFDLDGTLVRTGGAGIRALTRSFQKLYKLDDPTAGMTIAGNMDPNIFREIVAHKIPGKTLLPEEEEIIARHYLDYLKEEIQVSPKYSVLPGIREILERASSTPNLYVGLGTGNLEEGAKIKLERGGLNPYFSFGGFGSDSNQRNKVLSIALERAEKKFRIKFEASQVYVIGDTPRDIEAARTIGAKVLSVATGPYTIQDLKVLNPDLVLENLGIVEEFFSFIFKNGQ